MPTYKQSTRPEANSLKVVELFETVQGEGIYIGVPSVFFRTGMCNLECAGCDTKWDSWTETAIEACAEKIQSFKSKHLVLTGGEPTLWQESLYQLLSYLPNMIVTVETNGAVPITNKLFLQRVDHFSFSPKVGSLGRDEKFSWNVVYANIVNTAGKNQVKYVLDPNVPEDVDRVFQFHQHLDDGGWVKAERVFFQPYDRGTLVNIYARQVAFDINGEYNADLASLTKIVMERSGSRFRVVPQLHKYITWR